MNLQGKMSEAGINLDRVSKTSDGVYHLTNTEGEYVAVFGHATTATGDPTDGWDFFHQVHNYGEWVATVDELVVLVAKASMA